MSAFWRFYEALDRQGPGERADIDWVVNLADTPNSARICDGGCGKGADIAHLKAAVPGARITAVEQHAGFVEPASARFAGDRDITIHQGDMAEIGARFAGPFDLIWSAGAVYFLGIETALTRWRRALAPGGCVAFSEPCLFTETPSDDVAAFWQGEGTVCDEAGIRAQIVAAGFKVLGTRPLADAAWEAYYTPMEAVIARLRHAGDPEMTEILDQSEAEIAGWRAVRSETGYLLSVATPA